jgi:hypothetical protein
MFRGLIAFLLSTVALLAGEPWPAVKYAEARAYYYNEKGEAAAPLVKDGKLHPTVVNRGGTEVPPALLKSLLEILNSKKFESLGPACYTPRHGVVFYDRDKKIVAFYEVCFACTLQRSEPDGVAPLTDLAAVADIFEKLKLPLGPEGKTAKDVRKEWAAVLGMIKLTPLEK